MDILYLNAKDIEQIALTDAEIIGAIYLRPPADVGCDKNCV